MARFAESHYLIENPPEKMAMTRISSTLRMIDTTIDPKHPSRLE
jgi:hypothetical protein